MLKNLRFQNIHRLVFPLTHVHDKGSLRLLLTSREGQHRQELYSKREMISGILKIHWQV